MTIEIEKRTCPNCLGRGHTHTFIAISTLDGRAIFLDNFCCMCRGTGKVNKKVAKHLKKARERTILRLKEK